VDLKVGDWIYDTGYKLGTVAGFTNHGSVKIKQFFIVNEKPSVRTQFVDLETLKKAPVIVDIETLIDMALDMKDEEWFYQLTRKGE
jgi:IDEAL domain